MNVIKRLLGGSGAHDVCAKCGTTLEDRVRWWRRPLPEGVVKIGDGEGGLFLWCDHCRKAICGGCAVDLGQSCGCPFCKKELAEFGDEQVKALLARGGAPVADQVSPSYSEGEKFFEVVGPTAKIHLKLPQDWRVSKAPSGTYCLLPSFGRNVASDGPAIWSPGITVLFAPIAKAVGSVDSLLSGWFNDDASSAFDGFELVSKDRLSISDMTAYRFRFRFLKGNRTWEALALVASEGKAVYYVDASGLVEDMAIWRARIRKVLDTMEFTRL